MNDRTKKKTLEWLDLNDKAGALVAQMYGMQEQLNQLYAEMKPLEEYFDENGLRTPPSWRKPQCE